MLYVQSPHDASLLLRGLKTLAVRLERQSETALHLALFLSTHPAVLQVHYPGLPSHPQHNIAKRQMSKYGSMLSFIVVGGQHAAITVANVSSFPSIISSPRVSVYLLISRSNTS